MKKSNNETCRPDKNKARRLYSLLFIPVIGFCCWGLEIGNDTLNQTISNLWYIPFAIIGLAVGVIRLIRDKDIVWNKKEYLGGAFYALIHCCNRNADCSSYLLHNIYTQLLHTD